MKSRLEIAEFMHLTRFRACFINFCNYLWINCLLVFVLSLV